MVRLIEFVNVSKSFGSKKVLDELSFSIARGKITFVVGKSGEGKSVTIKNIIGLLHPDSGQIVFENQIVTKFTHDEMRKHRRRFGMLFQNAALFDSMTVEENIMFPLQEYSNLKGSEIRKRVQEVMHDVALAPDLLSKYPNELSTGERKRVGLGRALIAKPDIVLYDEPTTSMDPLVSEMIDHLIVKINETDERITSIVISHDLKAALATADTIIMLYKGKVALCGSPDEFKSTQDPIVRQFFAGKIEGPMEFV